MQPSKMKTLLIYEYLKKHSDDEHPVSSTELIKMLNENGIKAERKSIYSDIDALNEIGCDIITVRSPQRGYAMVSRDFQIPEVRLLIDAVSSAGFITPKKTEELISKLEGLLSENQVKQLHSQVNCKNMNKCDNEEIYYVIDSLDKAITQKKQVKFVYKRRNVDKENKKRYTEKTFIVSPYSLIWNDDHYYLVCNKSKYDNLLNLRLDRMKKISITDEPCRPIESFTEYHGEFDSALYKSKAFNMFGGENMKIKIKCSLKIQEEVLDRFGSGIPLKAVDTDHFETQADVYVSDGLVSWIMQFGADIEVLEPKSLADMILERAKAISAVYST